MLAAALNIAYMSGTWYVTQQFFERQPPMGPERVDDPDVLVEYLSRFHACKSTKNY